MKLQRESPSMSFLDSGTSIAGDLRFSGELRVDGDLHGSVETRDILIVGKEGVVQANISAGSVQILGTVRGYIHCQGSVEICDGGCLFGDVKTTQLILHEGAMFEGLSSPAAESTSTEPRPEPELRIEAEDVGAP